MSCLASMSLALVTLFQSGAARPAPRLKQHIIGGTLDAAGDPAVVELYYLWPSQGGLLGASCTGELIAPQSVLTAGHCTADSEINPGGLPLCADDGCAANVRDGTDTGHEVIYALFNDCSTPVSSSCQDDTINAGRYIYIDQYTNDDWDGTTTPPTNDIGVVHLAAASMDNGTAAPAPLPVNSGAMNIPPLYGFFPSVRFVGYGENVAGNTSSDGVKYTTTVNAAGAFGAQVIDADHTGLSQTGATTCFGDSGGPMLFTIQGVETIVSLNSTASNDQCAGDDIAQRVDPYFAWLQSVLSSWGDSALTPICYTCDSYVEPDGNCGALSISDGCGGTLDCPAITCPAGQACAANGTCCTPQFSLADCATYAECGPTADGCGGIVDCSSVACPSGQVCLDNEICCAPATSCAGDCGPVADGCGGVLDCTGSACPAGQTCGGAGLSGVCGTCVPQTCAGLGSCGGTPLDGCGGKLDCTGVSCPAGQTCNTAGYCYMCTPATCASLLLCGGTAPDGCGGTLDCSGVSCPSGQICGAVVQGLCCLVQTSCTGDCGVIDDGCGGTLDCTGSTCQAGQVCAAGGACCTPSPNCTGYCGDAVVPDGCGGTASCPNATCPPGEVCQSNFCSPGSDAGCSPTFIVDDCALFPSTCGPFPDGCGGTVDCGACPTAGQVCAPSGVCVDPGVDAGQCNAALSWTNVGCPAGELCTPSGICTGTSDAGTCVPTFTSQSCASSSACGLVPDGCGSVVACGGCPPDERCGGGGLANVCGGHYPVLDAGGCVLSGCVGLNCGRVSDGCGGVVSCGTCPATQRCGGSGVANVCGGDFSALDAGSDGGFAADGGERRDGGTSLDAGQRESDAGPRPDGGGPAGDAGDVSTGGGAGGCGCSNLGHPSAALGDLGLSLALLAVARRRRSRRQRVTSR